jgi:hypothetical protein
MYFSIFAKEYISKNQILFVHALSQFFSTLSWKAQEERGIELNGGHQFLVFVDNVNLLGLEINVWNIKERLINASA